VAVITALPPLALQAGANRVVQGIRIEHVCGDPSLSPEADRALRRRIVGLALRALSTDVPRATVFAGA
jgi:glycine reductase complex component B subunit gamma